MYGDSVRDEAVGAGNLEIVRWLFAAQFERAQTRPGDRCIGQRLQFGRIERRGEVGHGVAPKTVFSRVLEDQPIGDAEAAASCLERFEPLEDRLAQRFGAESA